MTWPCFWTERSEQAQLHLRRWGRALPGQEHGDLSICNASRAIDLAPLRSGEDGTIGIIRPAEYEGDPRWPLECDTCGRPFTEAFDGTGVSRFEADAGDNWQVRQEPIYRAVDGRGEWPMRDLPAGAMYDASWMPTNWTGPDGISLAVVLPNAHSNGERFVWLADGPATGGGRWTRVGDPRNPPTLTCNPSIFANSPHPWPTGYHGFLRDGILTDPL